MELRHLRYFIAAAEEQHFGRAADRLNVTRPAVSQIIADLEEEVGVPLFERLAGHVHLTAAGKTLLPHFVRVIDELRESLAIAKRVGQGKTGTLAIGYGTLTLMHSIFRAAVKQFRESYPDVTLLLVEMSADLQSRAIANEKIQARFMHVGPSSDPIRKRHTEIISSRDGSVLDVIHIQENMLGVAVSTDHRFATKEFVRFDELADEQFIIDPRSTSSPNYEQLHTLCRKFGFEPNVVQEVGTIASQLNLISCGMGIGLVVMGKGFSYPSSLSIVQLKGVDYPIDFVFGWVKSRKDPTVDRMIEIVSSLATSMR
jgi:DNA-binding transcriptional LysR family regulator